jgi:probable DNA metabolism protein
MEARLASQTDLAGFREEARLLLRQQVPPEAVQWQTAEAQNSDLFADPVSLADRPRDMPKAASAIVPASFLRLCEIVVLHHDADRFALLYRLLWRLVHEPGLRNEPLDPDMLHAHQMAQSVRRDLHKMKALVRFRPTPDEGRTLQLAWYEPAHHIVEAVAPWFAKRAGLPQWALFTPGRSAEWDGHQLHYARGVPRAQAPGADDGDEAWRHCYRNVFAARSPQASAEEAPAAP